jgi:hypothetical protein
MNAENKDHVGGDFNGLGPAQTWSRILSLF